MVERRGGYMYVEGTGKSEEEKEKEEEGERESILPEPPTTTVVMV
jgi:hypothetical protein